jgi:hypothetical protein
MVAVAAVVLGACAQEATERGGDGATANPSIDPQQERSYAVLRREPRAGDALPPHIDLSGGELFGVDPAAARRVELGGGRSHWVVPGESGLCLVYESARGSGYVCDATATARSTGLVVTASAEPESDTGMIHALVPDGAASAETVSSGGARERVPVRENVASAAFRRAPARLEWTDATGRHDAPVGAPSR